VKLVEDTGAYKIVTITAGAFDPKSRASESMEIGEGDVAWLSFPEESLKFYKDGKKVI
jgi:glycerol transport system ATP-binding protein